MMRSSLAAIFRNYAPPDGDPLLAEFPGAIGIDLWYLRWHIGQRVATPRECLSMVVPPECRLDPEIPFSGEVWRAMLSDPRAVPASDVAREAAAVSAWARHEGAHAVSLSFAEAAAVADPTSGTHARQIAFLLRERGEYDRAGQWFRAAISRARRAGDWETYTRAWIGLANVHAQRGDLEAAEELMRRAVRAGRRYRRRDATACALHNLLSVLVLAERLDEAEDAGFRAGRLYAATSPNLPSLANCIAYLLLLRGEHARALRIVDAALLRIEDPTVRLSALANCVRAAGVTGDMERYRAAWAEATWTLAHYPVESMAARALLDMARGALAMGRLSEAMEAMEWGRDVAGRQGEARTAMELRVLEWEVRQECAATRDQPDEADARLVRALRAAC